MKHIHTLGIEFLLIIAFFVWVITGGFWETIAILAIFAGAL
jgi:hypothetical protein